MTAVFDIGDARGSNIFAYVEVSGGKEVTIYNGNLSIIGVQGPAT